MARVVTATFERTATVVDVVAAPTRNGKMKYDVILSTGETVATFQQGTAQAAAQLKGQVATAIIEQSQNGQYTNLDLVSIQAGGAIGSGVPAPNPGVVAAQTPQVAFQAPQVAFSTPAPRDYSAEALGKTRHGQFIAALDFTANLLGMGLVPCAGDTPTKLEILHEVISWAEAGTHYASTGRNIAGASTVVEQQPEIVVEVAPVAATPEAVAAALPPGTVQVGTSGLPWGAQS